MTDEYEQEMTLDEAHQEIERKLTLEDSKGNIVLRIGLTCTLYFEDAHTPAKRDAVIQCIDEYTSLAGEHLTLAFVPGSEGKWVPYNSDKYMKPREYLQTIDEHFPYEFHFRGGQTYNTANPFTVGVTCGSKGDNQFNPSYLYASLPFTYYFTRDGSFFDLVEIFCKWLKPINGHGGLGFIKTFNFSINAKYEPFQTEMGFLYPGLDIENQIEHIFWIRNGIKSVNWLTVVGHDFLNNLGGLKAVMAQLDDDFEVREYPGGAIFKAGDIPQLGHAEKNIYPKAYVKLNHILKPIRVKEHQGIHQAGEGRMDDETYQKWLARFDNIKAD